LQYDCVVDTCNDDLAAEALGLFNQYPPFGCGLVGAIADVCEDSLTVGIQAEVKIKGFNRILDIASSEGYADLISPYPLEIVF
jgi:hypothetical protein